MNDKHKSHEPRRCTLRPAGQVKRRIIEQGAMKWFEYYVPCDKPDCRCDGIPLLRFLVTEATVDGETIEHIKAASRAIARDVFGRIDGVPAHDVAIIEDRNAGAQNGGSDG